MKILYAMTDFLSFLEEHWKGVLILFFCLIMVLFSIKFLSKLFCWGRYKNHADSKNSREAISYIVIDLLVSIINDFRHLLALIIVGMFFVAILYSLIWGEGDFNQRKEAIQLIVTSLGGLIGSIIGYYFGESAGKNKQRGLDEGGDTKPKNEEPVISPPTPTTPMQDMPEEKKEDKKESTS